jgi:hypothetical protein
MNTEQTSKPDWFDKFAKLLAPIIGGLLIAALAFFGNTAITDYTSRQENARLITQLQIQREQAESDLRKDIFQQAIGSLLSEAELKSPDLPISKRLLKLELLAENFGGSLSITPLFTEFDRDLEHLENAAGDNFNETARIRSFRKRLRSAARRLSSDQLSALAQQGTIFEIKVQLKHGGKRFADSSKDTTDPGDDEGYTKEYKWPHDEAASLLRSLECMDFYNDRLESEKRKKGMATLNGIERHVSVTLGDLDPQRRAVNVTLEICWDPEKAKTKFACDSRDKSVSRTFTLDYFNFPKVNNTRLSDNQRFSIVLEEFEPDPGEYALGFLEIAAVIFPAEYSSLRDRPSMQESVNLLNKVLSEQDLDGEDGEDDDANEN